MCRAICIRRIVAAPDERAVVIGMSRAVSGSNFCGCCAREIERRGGGGGKLDYVRPG